VICYDLFFSLSGLVICCDLSSCLYCGSLVSYSGASATRSSIRIIQDDRLGWQIILQPSRGINTTTQKPSVSILSQEQHIFTALSYMLLSIMKYLTRPSALPSQIGAT
jgi:hypothetical protein